MDSDEILVRKSEAEEILGTATSELQVALIYQQELEPLDYSRCIDILDSIAQAAYEEGREVLDELEDSPQHPDLSTAEFVDDPEKASLRENSSEWILMSEAGEAAEAMEEHYKNVQRSEPRYEGRVTGTELRRALEKYEELREAAIEYGVHDFNEIDDMLIDEETTRTILDDAEIIP
ncbi:hypothetical protein [Candidatus Nanohalobium constans]|uniref:Uncharacterized protein n=1 Tax=Candidatus Nanohalobium constans TaxID=2565781 RepID=A0A5Q0UGC0_9ARCH|nr:hypothetical protein [Candidatus Nanohalobium constans]QGA79995.1 hypothetical protein LC1Nh_0087 [Candidatus Nanohalobium constans]